MLGAKEHFHFECLAELLLLGEEELIISLDKYYLSITNIENNIVCNLQKDNFMYIFFKIFNIFITLLPVFL